MVTLPGAQATREQYVMNSYESPAADFLYLTQYVLDRVRSRHGSPWLILPAFPCEGSDRISTA